MDMVALVAAKNLFDVNRWKPQIRYRRVWSTLLAESARESHQPGRRVPFAFNDLTPYNPLQRH